MHDIFMILKECEDILARLGNDDDDMKMKMNAKMGLTIALQEVAFKLRVFQMEVISNYS